ncbi:hypothetical protein WN943_016296 [Citrus x changshan-huyou]
MANRLFPERRQLEKRLARMKISIVNRCKFKPKECLRRSTISNANSSSSSSKQKSQEAGSTPASMPLYSQSMWAVHSSSTDTANFGAFELISSPIILLLAQHQRGLDDLQDKSSSRDFRIMQNLFETRQTMPLSGMPLARMLQYGDEKVRREDDRSQSELH